MARRKFDYNTRTVFNQIQKLITEIDGKLLNKKETKATELEAEKNKLKDRARDIKKKYYENSSQKVINASKSLLEKLENFSINDISKN